MNLKQARVPQAVPRARVAEEWSDPGARASQILGFIDQRGDETARVHRACGREYRLAAAAFARALMPC